MKLTGSLRFRLTLTHVGVACLAIAVVALVVGIADARRFATYASATQQQGTQSVLAALSNSYEPGAGWSPRSMLAIGRLALMNGIGLAVYDPSGHLLFASPASGPTMATMMARMMSHGPSSFSTGDWQQRTVSITSRGATVASAVVFEQRAGSLPLNSAYRHDVILYLAAAIATAGMTSFLVGLWASRRITQPLAELTQAADAVAHGQREIQVNQTGGGEIGELAQSFNLMTQALARQEQWRHTAAADLAHELRTPLATIQARVEAIEDGVLPASPENLRVIGEEVERLGRLLSTLRRLDELDTGETRLNREPLNLRAFLTDVTDASRAAFTQAGLELRCDAEPVVLSADPDQLRQVLLNLLDNARKFTPSGGRVEIRAVSDDRSASRQGGRVLISVVDSGPGIPPEERGLVFDRFYRAHGAEGTEGAGLGLAIAKRIVEAHGGTIELATPAGGGTAVTISLPLDGLASGMTPRKSAKR